MEIKEAFKKFQKPEELGDPNGRYLSWEHCYSYFNFEKNNIDIKLACLHLAFYLASWGMYRGSSKLLQKDYLIHKSAVQKIMEYKELRRLSFDTSPHTNFFEKVDALKRELSQRYKDVGVTPTDTLISKIMMGTLGCVPAYDQFFRNGLKKSVVGTETYFNIDSLMWLYKFYQKEEKNFEDAFQDIRKYLTDKTHGLKFSYPPMKLLDMYFWSIGYEAVRNKK